MRGGVGGVGLLLPPVGQGLPQLAVAFAAEGVFVVRFGGSGSIVGGFCVGKIRAGEVLALSEQFFAEFIDFGFAQAVNVVQFRQALRQFFH